MLRAANEVVHDMKPCRSVAKDYNIPHTTLRRYCHKLRCAPLQLNETTAPILTVGYVKSRQVFSTEEEVMLVAYLLKASNLYYGLCPKEVRKLAYDFAIKLERKIPENWTEAKIAGVEWFTGFLKRHKNISLRTPEATSLGRATSFNRHNADTFFNNLEEVMNRHHFEPQDIWNIDETGFTTVQKPSKIISGTGVKQVGTIVSAERGTLVTCCCGVNALGNSIPPMFIFPRVNYRDHFVRDGPNGCIGAAHPSGWMTSTNFFKFMEHFVKHTRCSPEQPVLLLLDNHDSHVSVDILDFAKNSGVVMLSFPPHCSHKFQPLDRSVYFPLKKFYNSGCDAWLMMNKGKTLTIYDIPGIVKEAFPLAMTQANIQSGFRVSGIFPFNRNVFGDEEFLPSSVTDRPNPEIPETDEDVPQPSTSQVVTEARQGHDTSPGPSSRPMSPEDVRPFTTAGPRKSSAKGRKRGRTRILTDTPEKEELRRDEQRRELAKRKRSRRNQKPEEEEEEDSDTETSSIEPSEHSSEPSFDEDFDVDPDTFEKDDFILVEYVGKKSKAYYVGQIQNKVDEFEITTKFLRRADQRRHGQMTFVFPDREEIGNHSQDAIVLKLPRPTTLGGTKRCAAKMTFALDLSSYDPL